MGSSNEQETREPKFACERCGSTGAWNGDPSENTPCDNPACQGGLIPIALYRLRAAAPDLYEAAKIVLAGLNARIDTADSRAVPVFDGIADLHAAIAKVEAVSHG